MTSAELMAKIARHHIEHLIECLSVQDLSYGIDEPLHADGEWWIDLAFEGFSTNVIWQIDCGFGIFTSDDDAYGTRPDELYPEPELAAKRLWQLAKPARDDGENSDGS